MPINHDSTVSFGYSPSHPYEYLALPLWPTRAWSFTGLDHESRAPDNVVGSGAVPGAISESVEGFVFDLITARECYVTPGNRPTMLPILSSL